MAHQQAARVVGQGVGQGPPRVGEVLNGAHARLRVAAGARERAPVHIQRGLVEEAVSVGSLVSVFTFHQSGAKVTL